MPKNVSGAKREMPKARMRTATKASSPASLRGKTQQQQVDCKLVGQFSNGREKKTIKCCSFYLSVNWKQGEAVGVQGGDSSVHCVPVRGSSEKHKDEKRDDIP